MKILYKVLNALAVLTIAPALLFLPFFRFIASVEISSGNQLASLLGGLLGSIIDINSIIEKATGINIENLPEFYTIQEAVELFTGEASNGAFSNFDMSVIPDTMKIFFTLAFVLLVLALVFAVVIMISGFFTKKYTVPAVFSALGLASVFEANYSFSYVAEQLVSGRISVTNLLKGIEALSSYEKYLSYIDFDVRIFELSKAYNALILIFGALFIINIGFKVLSSVSEN